MHITPSPQPKHTLTLSSQHPHHVPTSHPHLTAPPLIITAEVEKQNLPVAYFERQAGASQAAVLLKVDVKGLEKAMCTHSTLTRGEVIVSPVNASSARDVRDAFVKGGQGRAVHTQTHIHTYIHTHTIHTMLRGWEIS